MPTVVSKSRQELSREEIDAFFSANDQVTAPQRRFLAPTLFTMLLALLGALEGWFKRTDYSTDAISYLDISRALPAHNWKMVFNPLWSVGYPALLALARPLFPASPGGEWLSIHAVNLLIFLGTWCAFLYLLNSFNFDNLPQPEQRKRFIFSAGACVFVALQLCVDTVSRVGPDMLVTAFFFLGTAFLVRLARTPSYRLAVVFGAVLGAGYWCKGIFLPLAAFLLLTAAAILYRTTKNLKPALVAGLVFAVVAAPYVAGLSWSAGRLTTGESGSLNYAFHINLLPHWTNWQGGGEYGTPIHPTQQWMKNPDLFVFAQPYPNTYPPFGNIVYWYDGYRHFWSAKYQAIGIARNLSYLAKVLATEPIFYATLASILFLIMGVEDRREWRRKVLALWPFYVSAALGIALYLQVHLEDRYLGSFFAILCMMPFVSAAMLRNAPSLKLQRRVLAVMALGAILNFALVDRDVFSHLRRHSTYVTNPQWKLGVALIHSGLQPGDGVAGVGGPNASCTWAYIAHLRIVAELGGGPYDQRHPTAEGSDHTVENFWRAQPEAQQKILSLFHQAGAAAVVASRKPADVAAPPGWQHVADTESWFYRWPSRTQ